MTRRINDEIWVDKGGRRHLVGEMSDSYAKNVLRLILRKQREARQELAFRKMIQEQVRDIESDYKHCMARRGY